MKVLLDTCVWGKAVTALTEAGHDAVWTGDWDEDPGDRAILQRAIAQQRIVITLDKDFGEMAVVEGLSHSGIVRLVGFSARQQGPTIVSVLERYANDLIAGSIVTVERRRVRIRPPED